jgi:HK97 family phage major capsid protein
MYAKMHADRCLTEARSIHQKAVEANRNLDTEERARFDGLMAEARQFAADAESDAEIRAQIMRLEGRNTELRPVVQDGSVRASGAPLEQRQAAPGREQAVLVPSWSEYRAAQAEGTDSLGGYTTPVEHSTVIIDRLRSASVFLQAFVRVFIMSSDVLRVPKIGTSATVQMVAENALIPESNLTFSSAEFVARKLAGLVRASNEWLNDSVPDARTIVEQDLIREIGQLLDVQLFAGNGVAPNLTGLINVAGVNATAISGALTLDQVSEAIERIETNYGTPNAVFMSPAVWGDVARLKDSDARYQINPDPTGDSRRQLFGVRVFVTPHVGDVVVWPTRARLAWASATA